VVAPPSTVHRTVDRPEDRYICPNRRTGSAGSPFRFEPELSNGKLNAIDCRGIDGFSRHCRQMSLLKLSPIPDSQAGSERRFETPDPADNGMPFFAFPRCPPRMGGVQPTGWTAPRWRGHGGRLGGFAPAGNTYSMIRWLPWKNTCTCKHVSG
jgi:hypothetical protein